MDKIIDCWVDWFKMESSFVCDLNPGKVVGCSLQFFVEHRNLLYHFLLGLTCVHFLGDVTLGEKQSTKGLLLRTLNGACSFSRGLRLPSMQDPPIPSWNSSRDSTLSPSSLSSMVQALVSIP